MERVCKFCGKVLAQNKRSHAIFCSVTCKKREEFQRRNSDPSRREANKLRARLWREKNPQQAKERVSAWQKQNRDRCSVIGRRYTAKKLKALPPWLNAEQESLIEAIYQNRDLLTKLTGVPHEVDHIVPLQGQSVCGLHVPWNLQVITKEQNVSKRHYYWPDMWD